MTHDVERVLADIDADHGDRCVEFLRHGVLLVLSAPCQLLILAGPEHGRTIPLADLTNARIIAPKQDIGDWKFLSRFVALSGSRGGFDSSHSGYHRTARESSRR